MKINETIFDTLSVIWIEKLHSQMISWIIETLYKNWEYDEISFILRELFKFKWELKYSNFLVGTEIKNIDVYIEVDSRIFIIENKIKSSEHSNQTSKYIEKLKIEKESISIFPCFLTLIWEKAINNNWKNVSYLDLENIFNSINKKSFDNSRIVFEYYLKTLKNINNTFSDFISNHTKYLHVFNDWGKTKYSKLNEIYNKTVNNSIYIKKYQLETIFQKAFLHKIVKKLNLTENNSYHISETHWMWIIQISFNIPIKRNWDKEYSYWFQLQWNTIKFNLSNDDYSNSRSTEINDKLIEEFLFFFNTSIEWNKYNIEWEEFGLNPIKTKAYISLSKKIWEDLYLKSVKEISSFLNKYLDFLNKQWLNNINKK